jgi:hypothetical protein
MRDSGSLAAPSFFSSWVARRQQWQPGGASPVALLCCERGRFVYIGRDLGSDKKQGAPPPVVGHRGEKITQQERMQMWALPLICFSHAYALLPDEFVGILSPPTLHACRFIYWVEYLRMHKCVD